MAQENYTPDETDFDDAIMEIAGEIEYLKSIRKSEIIQEAHVSLRSEIEVKKAQSISHSVFQMLKTIQEVQIFTGQQPSSEREPRPMSISKYIPSSRGKTHTYLPLTITESPIKTLDEENIQAFTLEDLFEDEPPEIISNSLGPDKTDGTSNVSSKLQKPITISQSSSEIISVNNSEQKITSDKTSTQTPKIIDIPSQISSNMGKHFRMNEREIFRNFLKIQKK